MGLGVGPLALSSDLIRCPIDYLILLWLQDEYSKMEFRLQTTIEQLKKALNEFAARQDATPKKKGMGWSLFGLNTIGIDSTPSSLYKAPSDQSRMNRLASPMSKSHETLTSGSLPRSQATTPSGIFIHIMYFKHAFDSKCKIKMIL